MSMYGLINVSGSKVKDETRRAAGNVIDLLTMNEYYDKCGF